MIYEPSDKIMQRIIDNIRVVDLGHDTPCYLWLGSNSQQRKGDPYARMSILGVTTAVHLYLWKRFNGPIKKKYQIDHKCNNTLCIRLDHLQQVTNLKNQRLRAKRTKGKTNERMEHKSRVSEILALSKERTVFGRDTGRTGIQCNAA